MAWKVMYEVDANGNPGPKMGDPKDKAALIEAVLNGCDIRVLMVYPREDNQERALAATPTIVHVQYGEVFAQFSYLLSGVIDPAKERNRYDFRTPVREYFWNVSTSGEASRCSIRVDNRAASIEPQAVAIRWCADIG